MEHIINALHEVEMKLLQAKNIDASVAWQIKRNLNDMVINAKFVERLIKDNKIEGII